MRLSLMLVWLPAFTLSAHLNRMDSVMWALLCYSASFTQYLTHFTQEVNSLANLICIHISACLHCLPAVIDRTSLVCKPLFAISLLRAWLFAFDALRKSKKLTSFNGYCYTQVYFCILIVIWTDYFFLSLKLNVIRLVSVAEGRMREAYFQAYVCVSVGCTIVYDERWLHGKVVLCLHYI